MSEQHLLTEGYWSFGENNIQPFGVIHAWKSEDGTRLLWKLAWVGGVVRGDDPVDQSYMHCPLHIISEKQFFLYKLKGMT